MENKNLTKRLKECEHILAQERQFLLTGRIDEIVKMAPKKEEIINALNKSIDQFDKDELSALDVKLKDNKRLLEAAMVGMRTVNNRLEEIRKSIGQLQTYNEKGQSCSDHTGGPTFSLKA